MASWCVILTCVVMCLLIHAIDVSTLPLRDSGVCIVGAGYSGLGTARHMKSYGLKFKVFEASRYIGGNWRFDPRVGHDEDGLPLFTSQYKKLRTNTPRQTMEFEDFPFPEGSLSYPTGTCFYKYLQSFVKHFKLLPHIQFRSLITDIRRVGDMWDLTYQKTDSGEYETEQCGFVVVATGMYNLPHYPDIQRQNEYRGSIIHSHDYKDAEDFRGQRVLLVGAGSSGFDLAVQLVNVTKKLVHSHHRKYFKIDLPKHYIKKPDVVHFTFYGAVFKDGTFEDFDSVIFCTGYDMDHPFLDEDTSGIKSTAKYITPLYQHIVNINNPSMTFVGVSKNIITRMWDVQGHYSAALAAGKFKLPPYEEMMQQFRERVQDLRRRHYNITAVNIIDMDMDDYFDILSKEAGIPRTPKVLTAMVLRDKSGFNENLLNYRDFDYQVVNDTYYVKMYKPRDVSFCPVHL